MNTLLLKYAVEVEKTGSISKAAENLYMNQPNLSKSIRELEQSVGVTIFSRTSRGVVPTSKGIEFLRLAKQILKQVDELEALYKADSPEVMPDIAASYIAYSLLAYGNMLHGEKRNICSSKYIECDNMRVIKNVACGEQNIGLVRCGESLVNRFMAILDEKRLSFDFVYNFSPKITFSKKSSLTTADNFSKENLKNYCRITVGCVNLPFSPAKEAPDSENFYKSVCIQNGVFGALELLSQVEDSYFVCEPLTPEILKKYSLLQKDCDGESMHDLIIYRHGYHMSKNEKLFLQNIKKTVQKLTHIAQ